MRIAAARALMAVGGLMLLATAQGHAVMMSSMPTAGQRLEAAPAEVSVTFNESVGPIFFRIVDPTGRTVGNPGEIRLDGARMILPLRDKLPKGTYALTYRVISEDTHPVSATFAFSVGEAMVETAAMKSAAGKTGTAWTYAVAANRWLLYCAMLLAAGSALFLLLLRPHASLVAATCRLGGLAASIAVPAYVLAVGFGGAEMVMGDARALLGASAWAAGRGSTLAPSAAIGVPAMVLLIWAFARSRGAPRSAALGVGAAAAIVSFLVTGHAATAAPVWLMATSVAVHLFGTAFWMGALYPLYQSTVQLSTRESAALMTRFSSRATYVVGAVVASGVLITWTQLASLANFFGNDYGAALIRKLVLFVVVIGIAAYNKFLLTAALEHGDVAAAPRIRRTIRVEYLLYILILGAAMTLTLTPPPRTGVRQAGVTGSALPVASDGIKQTILSADGYSVELELSPAKAGENMLMATVRDPSGKVLTGMADLEIVATLDSAGVSEIRLKGKQLPNGMWHVMISEMIIPGEWSLGVEAFVSDFDKIEFATKVAIR